MSQTMTAAVAAPTKEILITSSSACMAPQIAIVRPMPESRGYYALSPKGRCMLLNRPYKRSGKSADRVIENNDMLTIGLEMKKISRLYPRLRENCDVDFATVFDGYLHMTDAMKPIMAAGCVCETRVSDEDGCLYNYYEIAGKKVFFNLFFDEGGRVDAVVNVSCDGRFRSLEGTIDGVVGRLREFLRL